MPEGHRYLQGGAVALPRLGAGGGSAFCVLPEDAASAVLIHARDRGFTYFDTAPYYGQGLSEHRFGTVLRQVPRDSFVLSTKVGRLLKPDTSAEAPGRLPFAVAYDYGYDAVMRSLDDSLQRLGLPRVDIVYIHDLSPQWHGDRYEGHFRDAVEGGYRALDELRKGGVIKAVGVGIKDYDVCLRFANTIDLDCIMLAGGYTLLNQGAADALLPHCLETGLPIVLASPFNSGILATGAVAGASYFYREAPPEIIDRVRRLQAACDRHAVPLGAAAMQFPLAHPAIGTLVGGYASPAEIDTNLGWATFPIPGDLWTDLKTERLISDDAPVPGNAA